MDDLDFEILAGICQHQRLALDFAFQYDEKLFRSDYQNLARSLIGYAKTFKSRPSRKAMVERHSSEQELIDQLNNFFDELENYTYNDADYGFDVSKLKDRYSNIAVENFKTKLATDSTDYHEAVREMQKSLNDIKSLSGSKAYERSPVKDYVDKFVKNYQDKAKNPDLGKGIGSGYSFFDYVKNGFFPADLVIIAGETGSGKALDINTPIPTPTGWTKMGDIKEGDFILGDDGKPCKVIKTSGIMYNHECYELEFSDGAKIIADKDHLWKTKNNYERNEHLRLNEEFRAKRRIQRGCKEKKNYIPKLPPEASIKTTEQIANTVYLNRKLKRVNHSIDLTKPLDLDKVKLPIDPYVLGAWLGDGTSCDGSMTSADPEIIEMFKKKNYTIIKRKQKYLYGVKGFKVELRNLGVLENKHIPNIYLRASFRQRLELIRGLMDTDGFASPGGHCEFDTTSKKIRDGMLELLISIGIPAKYSEGIATLYGREISPKYRISFVSQYKVFRLKRKAKRQRTKKQRFHHRFIVGAKKVDSVPVQCIQVDNCSHMFLCGKEMIPTHNSIFMNNMAINAWMQKNTLDTPRDQYTKGYNVAYFTLEMPYEDCYRRTISKMADVGSYAIRDAKLNRSEVVGIKKACQFMKNYPYTFDIIDVPRGFSVDQLELTFEEIKSNYTPDLIVIDYMGLMENASESEEDWLALGKIAGKLHEFSRQYSLPILTGVQLNRVDPSSKNKIGLHRIGRSSLIATHSSCIIQLESRVDEAQHDDFIYHILKNRHGGAGQSHTIYKNFANSSIIDKQYDSEEMSLWTANDNIGVDISDILGNLDD